MLLVKFAPFSYETLIFEVSFFALLGLLCLRRLLAVSGFSNKMIKNIICLEHFWAKMELSLKRRASDVHRLIAGAANPSSSTAIGPLGAHLDPR